MRGRRCKMVVIPILLRSGGGAPEGGGGGGSRRFGGRAHVLQFLLQARLIDSAEVRALLRDARTPRLLRHRRFDAPAAKRRATLGTSPGTGEDNWPVDYFLPAVVEGG